MKLIRLAALVAGLVLLVGCGAPAPDPGQADAQYTIERVRAAAEEGLPVREVDLNWTDLHWNINYLNVFTSHHLRLASSYGSRPPSFGSNP